MREVLRSLAALEGPKSVILISEGLVLDGLGGATSKKSPRLRPTCAPAST